MIIFDKIRFKNFMSVGNYWVTIDISKYKNIVITGQNGSGKSTVLGALSYSAFGEPFTKVKLGELVNTINKHLETELFFRKGKDSYKIRRGMKPDFFEIYKNEELLPQNGNKKDYQAELNKVFGFDHKIFTRTILLGSAVYQPFMQLDAKDRRLFIDKFFDLEVLTSMSDGVKKDIKDLKTEIKEIDFSIEKINAQIEIWRASEKNESNKDKEKITEYNSKIEKANEEILLLEESRKEIEEKIKDVDIKKYQDTVKQLKSKLGLINSEISKIEYKNSQNRQKRDSLSERTVCPECRQEISEGLKEILIKEYEDVDSSDKTLERDDVQERITKIEDFFVRYNEFAQKIKDINNSIASFNKEINLYTLEIKELNKTSNTMEYDKIIKTAENNIKNYEKEKEEKVKELKIAEVSSIMLKDDGIKASIIKTYLPVINNNINKYLEFFNFFLRFELNEEFEEILKSRHVEERSYYSFSEGQKKRIDLSILLAFKAIGKAKNRINSNLVCYDEILDRLDAEGSEAFMKLVKSEPTTNIIISHSEDIINQFQGTKDCSIKVELKNKFSYYEIN